jgi:ubiquinone/menaquinone biosynthesis C-methylase UbiE
MSPDIETSSPGYAARFSGRAGAYLLSVQTENVRDLIAPYSGGSLLEIGGGHGQLVDLYEQLGFAYQIQGSDQACFAYALKNLPPEQRVICNMRKLPFEDSSVDVVVAIRLIAHLEDWEDILHEMCRVARQAVVIDFPALQSLNGLSPLMFDLKRHVEGNTRSYASYSMREIRVPFEKAHFKIERIAKQFFLPIFLHRALKGHALAQGAERMMRAVGITAMLGSPVILRATRVVTELTAIQ